MAAFSDGEATLRSIFQAAPIAVGLVADRVLKKVNERLCSMLGYSAEELVGQSARVLYPTDEDYEYVGREKYGQIRARGVGTVETRWRCKDGRIIDVLLSSSPLDPADLSLGVTFTALDITERKRVEEAFKVAEREKAAVLDAMSELVAYQDLDGRILWANRAAGESVGTKPEDLVGRRCYEIWHGRSDWCEACPIARARQTGQPEEGVVTSPDGRDWLIRGYPIRDEHGEIIGIVEVTRDITERKRAEEALRESEQWFRDLYENAPSACFSVGLDGRIHGCNRRAGELLGCPVHGLVGRHVLDLYADTPHGKDKAARVLERFRSGETTHDEELQMQRMDGTPVWISLTVNAVRDAHGQIVESRSMAVDITGRKEAEEARRESEEKYRSLIINIPDVAWTTDSTGRTTFISPNVERVYGFTQEEIYKGGKQLWWGRIHPDDVDRVTAAAAALFERDEPFDVEYRIRHKNGAWIWLRDWAITTYRKDGVKYADGVFSDITRHKQAEETLWRERDRAAVYLDVAEVAFIGIDPDERVTLVNRKACGVLGYTEAEIVGRNWFDHFLPERIREETRGVYRRIMSGDVAPVEYHENPALTKGGEERMIAWHNALLFDDAGTPVMSLSSGEDITERRRAEIALRESEEKYRCIVENSLDVVMLTRPDGVVSYLSPACDSVLGYAPEDLVGTKPNIIYPEDRPKVTEAFQDAMQGLSGSQIEYRVRTKKGSTKWISHSWSPVLDDGRLTMVVSMVRDITERKTAEERRRELEEQLRQAQKMEALGVLAAGVAHDLNNVMTAIMNYASLVHLAPSNEERVREASERIRQAVDQATGLTRSLLTFSRRATMDKSPVHLGQTILNAIALLRRMLPAAIEIVTEASPSEPDLWVEADATQLQQVMMNLAVNARDAMPDGGTLHVSVAHRAIEAADVLSAVATRGKGAAVLTVEDTGIGMSDEVRAHIFEPFFTTKPREQGTGLGLAVVHGIVSDHGGTIRVESEVRHGTCIEVAFPCCDPPGAVARPLGEGRAVPGHGELILVAEDNEVVRNLVASALRSSGYRVVECGDGSEAMNVFKAHRARLGAVILDVDLPHKSGTACLREMRSACHELPAVVMTGSVGPSLDDLVDAYTRGLYKPFLVTELIRLLNDVLGSGDRETTSR